MRRRSNKNISRDLFAPSMMYTNKQKILMGGARIARFFDAFHDFLYVYGTLLLAILRDCVACKNHASREMSVNKRTSLFVTRVLHSRLYRAIILGDYPRKLKSVLQHVLFLSQYKLVLFYIIYIYYCYLYLYFICYFTNCTSHYYYFLEYININIKYNININISQYINIKI